MQRRVPPARQPCTWTDPANLFSPLLQTFGLGGKLLGHSGAVAGRQFGCTSSSLYRSQGTVTLWGRARQPLSAGCMFWCAPARVAARAWGLRRGQQCFFLGALANQHSCLKSRSLSPPAHSMLLPACPLGLLPVVTPWCGACPGGSRMPGVLSIREQQLPATLLASRLGGAGCSSRAVFTAFSSRLPPVCCLTNASSRGVGSSACCMGAIWGLLSSRPAAGSAVCRATPLFLLLRAPFVCLVRDAVIACLVAAVYCTAAHDS